MTNEAVIERNLEDKRRKRTGNAIQRTAKTIGEQTYAKLITIITRVSAVGFPLPGMELEVPFPLATLVRVDSARVSLSRFLVSICSLFVPNAFAVGSVRILQVHYTLNSLCLLLNSVPGINH